MTILSYVEYLGSYVISYSRFITGEEWFLYLLDCNYDKLLFNLICIYEIMIKNYGKFLSLYFN